MTIDFEEYGRIICAALLHTPNKSLKELEKEANNLQIQSHLFFLIIKYTDAYKSVYIDEGAPSFLLTINYSCDNLSSGGFNEK